MTINNEQNLKAAYTTARQTAAQLGIAKIVPWEAMQFVFECVPLLATASMVPALVTRPELAAALPHCYAQRFMTSQLVEELSGWPEMAAFMNAMEANKPNDQLQLELARHSEQFVSQYVPEAQQYRAYLMAASSLLYIRESMRKEPDSAAGQPAYHTSHAVEMPVWRYGACAGRFA